MRVVLLGSGGYHPSEERHTACLLAPELGLMLDAGTGAFRIPKTIEYPELDIFLTHAHLDHVCGLTYLLPAMATKQLNHVRVHASEDVLDALRTHLFAPAIFPVLPAFQFQPLAGELYELSGATVRWKQLRSHPGMSVGYRVEWTNDAGEPRSFAYITDTSVDGTYVEFVRGVNLLIHECYFPDAKKQWALTTGHSTTSQVLALAEEAGVGRLVLTHVDPRSTGDDPLELKTLPHGSLSVELARDGMVIDV